VWQTVRRFSFLIVLVVVVAGSAAYGALHQAAIDDDAFETRPRATPTTPPPADAPGDGQQPQESARTLFVHSCGTCHTLRAAGAGAGIGPNLDKVRPRLTALRVRDQIRTGTLDSAMPANLLLGRDADRVARYVARVAGPSH
jgi:mono/diheme cytochrome c family protein